MGHWLLSCPRFPHSPLFQPSPPSSSRFSAAAAARSCTRKKPTATALAFPPQEGQSDRGSDNRRLVLLVGLSALPLLHLQEVAAAAEALVKDKQSKEMLGIQGLHVQDRLLEAQQNEAELALASPPPVNPFLALLNGLGVIGSGVLGALYAISEKEKADMESEIESMNNNLNEKDAAKALLERNFESKLLMEKDKHHKELNILKEEAAFLSKQLTLAKSTATSLGSELQSEKRYVEEFKLQIEQLHCYIEKASEDKRVLESKLQDKLHAIESLQDKVSLLTVEIRDKEKNIEELKSSLDERDSVYKNLKSLLDKAKLDLEESNSAFSRLQTELLKIKGELDSKNACISDMDEKISFLLKERDDISLKFHSLQKQYNELKSDFAQKSASDSELLCKKDEELHQLEENLSLALVDAENKQALVATLKNERDSISAMLDEEASNVKSLRNELQLTQAALKSSKLEVSNLVQQREESNKVYNDLVCEVTRVKSEFAEAERRLNVSLEEARSSSELLSDELSLNKEILNSTMKELTLVSDELKAAVEDYENLKKELLETYTKAEVMKEELEEERKVAAALKHELEDYENLVVKHSEARISLEKHLDETTISLDEMNKKALSLSNELQNANTQNATLDAEKEMLYLSLTEQKNLTKEVEENMEDAQNVIKKLGVQREDLERKVKKFEEELASAKGEILRLRRQITLSKESTSDKNKSVYNASANASVVSKKSGRRRRKTGTSSQVSDEET